MTDTVYILRYIEYKSTNSNFHGVYKTKELAIADALKDCEGDNEATRKRQTGLNQQDWRDIIMKKQKRVVVYLPEEDYKNLRAKLILTGKTVSGWFRELVNKFLEY